MLPKRKKPPKELMPVARIQSGDLLAWRRDSHSTYSDLVLQGIRFATGEKYGHVGIAWRCHDGLDDELFVIEATMPKIRIAHVTVDSRDFDCVPMGLNWDPKGKEFLMRRQGYPYSIADAIRAFIGLRIDKAVKPEKDNKYQCVELAHDFYKVMGIDLGNNYTPGRFVRAAETHVDQKAFRVVENLPSRQLQLI